MGRPKGSTKKKIEDEVVEDAIVSENLSAYMAEPKSIDWGNYTPKRRTVVEELTRDILLKKLEFKSGRGFAADVQHSREIAEAFADSFGYKD